MPSSVQPAVSEASCPEWPEHPFSGFLKQVFLKHSRSDSGRASPANIRHAVSTRRCRGSRTLACTLHASSTPVQGRHSENPFSGRSPEAGFPGGASALPFRFGSGFSGQYLPCDQYAPVPGQQNNAKQRKCIDPGYNRSRYQICT